MPEYDARGLAACAAFIFFGVSSTFVTQASEQDGHLAYNTTTANLIVEMVKFLAMFICWSFTSVTADTHNKDDDRSWLEQKFGFQPSLRNLAPYSVPGLMYAFQNQLLFHAVIYLRPAMFQLTSKLKFVSTAVFSRLVLKKSLTSVQWLGILVLLFGMTVSKSSMFCTACPKVPVDSPDRSLVESDMGLAVTAQPQPMSEERFFFIGLCMVLTTSTISGASGIANEFLLKQHDEKVHVFMKNAQLYLWGVIFNLIGMFGEMWARGRLHPLSGFSGWTWLLIALKAAEGISISFIMKYLDNLIKCFASAIIVYLTALISYFFFDDRIDSLFVVGLCIVSIALALYFGPFNDILKEHEKPWEMPKLNLMSWQVKVTSVVIVMFALVGWSSSFAFRAQ